MNADELNEHESRGRGVYPRAGVEGLQRLNELDDFKVADHEPDIRGWDVVGTGGEKIGEVHDLLVDTAAMKVRYVDVDLDRDAIGGAEDRHVLVPIGAAQLDDDDDKVRLPRLSAAQLATLPAYEHGMLNRDQERALLGQYGTLGATAATAAAAVPVRDEDFYGHDYFDERRICRGQRELGADARYVRRST